MTVASASDDASEHERPHRPEKLLRAVFDWIGEGFCLCETIVDPSGVPVDYRFLDTNPLFTARSGIENPVGRTAREVIGDLEPGRVTEMARVGLGRTTARFQLESRPLGRCLEVFAVPAEPYGTFALAVKEQSAHLRAESARSESEERFHGFADQLPLIVWAHGADPRPDWVNQQFRRYFGPARDDLGRQCWIDVLHPDDRSRYVAEFHAAVAGRRSFHREIRVRRADGAWRWLESWANPLRDADGEYLGHVVVGVDVTDRRRAEEAIRVAAGVQAYRARLLAALRTISDPVEVQARAAELLGEQLGAAGAHYAEVGATGEYVVGYGDHHPESLRVTDTHRFDDYGPLVMNEVRAGRVVAVADVAADLRLTVRERAAAAALGVGAYVVFPLVRPERSVVLLVVHHTEPHDYSPEELALVEETADLTWAAVEQARAETALRVRHARAELVAELLSDLERQPTVAARAHRLAELLVPRFADYAVVEALGREKQVLGIAHRDLTQVETLRCRRTDGGVDTDDSSRRDPRSPLAVPLDLGGGVDGVLVVGLTDPRRPPYTEDDRAFLQETAQRVGTVLAAARLRQEEHDISVRLQQALLPDKLLWHPNVLVEARYHAASALLDVGGDWYDTFAWPDGRLGLMVGDVVGHNLDSAAAMGRLRAATAALATHTPASPAALIDALDRFASGPNGTEFATAVCVVVDPETGRMTYSSAGHPPVLVVPPGGPPIRLLDAQSIPLCSLSVGARPESIRVLEPGSLVVMYSDGLVERRGQPIETGIARLERRLVELSDQPADVVADRLIADTSADSSVDDDIVVACLRYTPVRLRFVRTLSARADELARLRTDLRTWLGHAGVGRSVQRRTLLAVGEACANAIEHAYLAANRNSVGSPVGPAPGDIEVELTHHGGHLTARVRDHGTWRPAARLTSDRGRGTSIMQAVGSRFVRRGDAQGTSVTLTFSLPALDEEGVPEPVT